VQAGCSLGTWRYRGSSGQQGNCSQQGGSLGAGRQLVTAPSPEHGAHLWWEVKSTCQGADQWSAWVDTDLTATQLNWSSGKGWGWYSLCLEAASIENKGKSLLRLLTFITTALHKVTSYTTCKLVWPQATTPLGVQECAQDPHTDLLRCVLTLYKGLDPKGHLLQNVLFLPEACM